VKYIRFELGQGSQLIGPLLKHSPQQEKEEEGKKKTVWGGRGRGD